jgi:uncharacterized protein (TIGR03084 family)
LAGPVTTDTAASDPKKSEYAGRPGDGRIAFDELLDDLLAETASLGRVLTGVHDADWDMPTPAADWSIRDHVGHLAYFDETALLALTEPERFAAEATSLAERGDNFADAVVADQRHRPPDELLPWMDHARAALVRAYRGADPKLRTPWYGPAMSAMSAATARLMETWAHGVDVVDALGVRLEGTSRLRHIAHLGFRTLGFSFSHHGLEVPAIPVRVELTGEGRRWVFGPEGARDVVRGTALDFCLVVTQRRHVDDTSLAVHGPVAAAWMDVAQIFAGPPTMLPAPRRLR